MNVATVCQTGWGPEGEEGGCKKGKEVVTGQIIFV